MKDLVLKWAVLFGDGWIEEIDTLKFLATMSVVDLSMDFYSKCLEKSITDHLEVYSFNPLMTSRFHSPKAGLNYYKLSDYGLALLKGEV